MDGEYARSFAEEWICAWNNHDLDQILSHYADDIVFLTPKAIAFTGDGRVAGKKALRDYWGRALQALPNLRFELSAVFAGHNCLTIQYRNDRGQAAAETMEFGEDGDVIRSFACYAVANESA